MLAVFKNQKEYSDSIHLICGSLLLIGVVTTALNVLLIPENYLGILGSLWLQPTFL